MAIRARIDLTVLVTPKAGWTAFVAEAMDAILRAYRGYIMADAHVVYDRQFLAVHEGILGLNPNTTAKLLGVIGMGLCIWGACLLLERAGEKMWLVPLDPRSGCRLLKPCVLERLGTQDRSVHRPSGGGART